MTGDPSEARRFETWLQDLEQRYLADLTVSEVARALRALSSNYVERRDRLIRKSALDSAGKRAAYALFYSPLHFLTVRGVVDALGMAGTSPRRIVDLGCGAGAAGLAWATRLHPSPTLIGLDRHPWAVAEAKHAYRLFGLAGDARRGDANQLPRLANTDAIVAGWVVNEIGDDRAALLPTLQTHFQAGGRVLVIEPIATRVSPWWREWATAFQEVGGRADEWRFDIPVPLSILRLGRAAGLRVDRLQARSLWA